MCVNRRSGERLDPPQLPRRVDVEALEEIIKYCDGNRDGQEDRSGDGDDDENRDHAEHHENPHPDEHRQNVVDHVEVPGESVHNPTQRRRLEKCHRESHDVVQKIVVTIARDSQAADGER